MKLVTRKVRLILLRDDASAQPVSDLAFITSYDELMERVPDGFGFRDFDENTRATTFYTTGTTGEPKAVAYSYRQLVLHTMGSLPGWPDGDGQQAASRRCLYADHPDVPRPCLGFPYSGDAAWHQAGLCWLLYAGDLLRLIAEEGATFTHCVPTILQMLLAARRRWTPTSAA